MVSLLPKKYNYCEISLGVIMADTAQVPDGMALRAGEACALPSFLIS